MTSSLLRGFSLSSCLIAVAIIASPLHAQLGSPGAVDQQEPGDSLPDVDVRYEGDRPAGFVTESLKRAANGEVGKLRELERKALAERVPELRMEPHPLFGTPHFLRSTIAPLAASLDNGAVDPESVVADFLLKRPGLFEVHPDDLRTGRVTRSFTSRQGGVQHWTVQQQHRGLDVFGCELRANVGRSGELINLSSGYLPLPDEGFRESSFRLAPNTVLSLALDSVGQAQVPVQVKDDSTWPQFASWEAEGWEREVTAERLYFPMTRLELRAAYYINLGGLGGLNNYHIILDANTGETLWRWNGVLHLGGTEDVTFRAFTTDNPRPLSPGLANVGNSTPPEAARSLITVTGASVAAASPLGWINDGSNTTTGNNCLAQSDLLGTNNADPRPVGSPFRVFDQPMDLTQEPINYTQASVINIFYWGNLYHDRLYAAGFDEASGNFQAQNFGNGGAGGDPMLLDAQDGGDTNNARYFHSLEGTSARIEMYRFTGPFPDHDGSLDSDVVFHELAHGTSLRLIGGLNVHQSAGMGEGWGDFIGVALNSEDGDDPSGNYTMGPYASDGLGGLQSSYYFGIRRFPYSTDLAKNPLTFADIDPGQFGFSPSIPANPISNLGTPDEIHQVGEVWCLALWECRANLIAANGFAGNDMMLELVIEGMKLTPSSPNFLEARDGILQADVAINGGANLGDLWAGFAKRGMGVSATSPSAISVSGVVEAFDVPPGLVFAYPNGRPTQLIPNQTTDFEVRAVGSNPALTGSGLLFYRVNGGSSVTVPMAETLPGQFIATLPALSCFDKIEYSLIATNASATFTDPVNSPSELYAALVFEGTAGLFADDFESDQGWTVSSALTDGQWERGVPLNNGRGDPAADFDGSGVCFLSDNDPLTTNSDIDDGSTTVTSPLFDLGNGGLVTYAYWLNDIGSGALSNGDTFDVEVATDPGSTNWTLVRSYDTAESFWRTDSILVGTDVATSSTVRFRFTASDINTQNVVESGLDAFTVSSLSCTGVGTEYCFGDTSGNTCPCGNNVPLGTQTGCLNSTGTGARITASGQPSVSNDTLHFDLISAPPSSFALLVSGDNQLFGGLGIHAFDGLRCVGGNFQRHGGRSVGANGQANAGWGGSANPQQGLIAQGLFGSGQTRNFQVFYRDLPSQVCGLEQNSSTAFSVSFLP